MASGSTFVAVDIVDDGEAAAEVAAKAEAVTRLGCDPSVINLVSKNVVEGAGSKTLNTTWNFHVEDEA